MDVRTSRARPLDGAKSTPEFDRLPPHDPDAEASLLGSMLIDPQVIGEVCMVLDKPDAFFSRQNQIVFQAMLELFEMNTGIDAVTLLDQIAKNGVMEQVTPEYIQSLIDTVPSAANASYYARIVRDKALLRQLISVCTSTLTDCYQASDEAKLILDRGEKRIFDLAQQKISGNAAALSDVLQETFEMLDRHTGEHLTGIASGYIELDNLTCGFQRGEMIIIAARPSVGKTALAMNIVEHVGVDLQKPVLVFSLEMSKQQLAQRMLCARSGVDSHKLRSGTLSQDDRTKLTMAVGELSEGKIFIDDTPGLTALDLRSKARRLKQQQGIEMVVIDYLQLMEAPREESRQQEISSISRSIKALARELDVPVICLSQLNRESEKDKRLPRTSDLRESGSIEQDADVVMLLHRESVLHRGDEDWAMENPDKLNEAKLIIAKQRNGPCDTVTLTFLSESTRFVNYHPSPASY
jgi:replicative DNA helicase